MHNTPEMETGEFRRMLLKLANGIKTDELGAMKFLCTGDDKLTRRRAEEIKETHELWTALEEADLINKDDTQFLKTLLETGCKNRQDLLKIYTDYTQGQGHVFNKELNQAASQEQAYKEDLERMQREVDLVVREIGRDWRPLARKLGLNEADIDSIVEEHRSNLREQCREMLKLWIHNQRFDRNIPANRVILIQALLDSEKRALANKVSNFS